MKFDCCFNNTISERDMDMLLAEAIVSDNDFCQLVIDKTDLKGKAFKVIKVEVSKGDKTLGETDVTVVLQFKGGRYGLLIEDKIDAIAMPNQHERYKKRGEKGIENGEYKDYRIFIFCPSRYYKNNSEAKLYEHVLTYEECKEFFGNKNDALSQFRAQLIEQAIKKAKKPSTAHVNEAANLFLQQYMDYQKKHYPFLDLRTGEKSNGWWTGFRTELGRVTINHKIEKGYVDLNIPKASDKTDRTIIIVDWLRCHKISDATVYKGKKNAMIRIRVPKLDIMSGFENVDLDELNQCFDAIKELTEFANMVEMVNSITKG